MTEDEERVQNGDSRPIVSQSIRAAVRSLVDQMDMCALLGTNVPVGWPHSSLYKT